MMSTEQSFDCVFCKEVFENKETLQIHFRKHGDPNFNPTIKKMRSLNETPNEMTTEDNEMVGCDVCDEVFTTISKAITHKHKAHPDHDAKYFCPFCGKLFTMKHLYNKHMQSNHVGGKVLNTREFYCDCCKVNFYAPAAMLHHNKFFHRQDTELLGVGHSKKVKKVYQEMIQIYYCSFCGEEYNNKVNLHKHMVDDHSDENQSPSEILRCPLCEAIFYHLDAYEVHLTFHSTEDIYSEKNEMLEEVTEFSLETVVPIMEKVEEEMAEKTEDGASSGCIDNFLQLVMGESRDSDGPEKVKSKKHKKHKKSKKAAITLDEFLNMNKDVFGDGLDVQGIEEVPTQAVLRKTKGIKLPVRNDARVINDLAKLKKQGIIIKTKSNKRATADPFIKKSKHLMMNSPKVANNPNEILSKLSQGNSQIKIVKKSVGQNSGPEDDSMELTAANCIETNNGIEEDISDAKEHVINTSNSHTPDENDISDNTPKKSETNNFKISENKTEELSGTNTSNKDNISNNDNVKNNTCVAIDDIKSKTSTLEETRPRVLNPPLQDLNNLKSVLCNKTLDETKKDLLQDYNINTQYDTYSKSDRNIKESDLNEDNDVNEMSTSNRGANKTLNALKHLSHSLTVKSVNQTKFLDMSNKKNETISKELNSTENANDYSQNNLKTSYIEQRMNKTSPGPKNDLIKNTSFEQHSDFDSDSDCNNDNVNIKQVKLKIKSTPPVPHKILKNTNIKLERNVEDYDDKSKEEGFSKPTSDINILKRLSNVTAKSISVANNDNKLLINTNRPIANHVHEMSHKNISEQRMKEEEIFNIDDSDSDGNDHFVHKKEEKQPNVALDSLRNINKNITVKSSQQTNITELKDKKIETKTVQSNRSTEQHLTFTKHSSDIQKSINLQNKLKNLSGNITVKSNNPSPNIINKELYKTFEEYDNDDEFDSGPEMNVGKVKITEVNEEEMSENDDFDSESNAIVQSPNASNSDNEYNEDDIDDNFADFEEKIKYTAVKKLDEETLDKKPSACLENFKNLNKNLTIKSLTSKKYDSEDEANTDLHKDLSEDKPLNRQVAIKQFKPNSSQNEQPINRPVMNQPSASSSQTINKNVSTSSNQVNTVKTVKKIQSQTVIEEITTTVTKTIRTVNQSSNEVVQSNIRCGPRPIIRPQKIINRPTNIQGTGVRQSIPTIGTRIRNATHMVRHPAPSAVRPSNQIVPVRPVLFAQRNPSPSTSAIRKIAPPRGSPQKPTIGKLKISPQALSQTMKRPSDEGPGHFSCFKKPKEVFTNDMGHSDDDGMVQYASASHSQSNFSSVTKTVKGVGAVTATQMRSEVMSSQQLSKLSNVSGLKIVKTSSKQAMQVEEKCDISPAQRNTLNALEKLQKHGLLVKKPRIDDYNEHYSHSESDDETSDK